MNDQKIYNITPVTYLITGKIGAVYGVKGWLRVHSYTQEIAGLLDYQPWYISDQDDWRACEISDGKVHGKGLIVKFPGIDTPELARSWVGKKIAIKRDQLKKLANNEYYWADLEGLSVIHVNGKLLGKVAYLIETGSNDVLVIKDDLGKEHAIPYLKERVIKEVNLKEKTITVDWELI